MMRTAASVLTVLSPAPLPTVASLRRSRATRPVLSVVDGCDLVGLRRAQAADVVTIHELLAVYARSGALLPRTRAQVAAMIDDFVVAEESGALVGCAALRLYSAQLAELAALAVVRHYHGRGVGRRLVEALLADARVLHVPRVFAVTLRAAFFHRLGFQTVPIAAFPEKIAADCHACARRQGCREVAVARFLEF